MRLRYEGEGVLNLEKTIEALKKHIESLGYYTEITFREKSEHAIFFTATDVIDGGEVSVKAEIDDEMHFDEWSLWEIHEDASDWSPLD